MKAVLYLIVLLSNFFINGFSQCYFAQNIAAAWGGETASNVTYSYNGLAAQTNIYNYSGGTHTFYINEFGANPRYARSGNVNYSIHFSTPVPAAEIGLLIHDVNASNQNEGGRTPYSATLTLTVTGFGPNPATTNDFTPSTASDGDENSRLITYAPSSGLFTLTPPATMYLVRQNVSLVGNSQNLVTGLSITSSGIDASDAVAYSFFYKSGCPIILPNKVATFSGKEVDNSIQFNWTSSAANINYFQLEKSIDGINFEPIGQVSYRGSKAYMYTYNGNNGKAFYRLKISESDGKVSYTDALQINRNFTPDTGVTIYPNPTSNILHFSVNSQVAETVKIRILDVSGRIVNSQNKHLQKGKNIFAIHEFSRLAKGIYSLNIYTQSGIITERVVKH